MTKEQFRRLTDVFWKTATVAQITATYQNYQDALSDVSESAMDRAIKLALKESERMPFPKTLRGYAATSATPVRPRGPQYTSGCSQCGGPPVQRVHPTEGTPWRYALDHTSACRLYDPDVRFFRD